ncbi:MAG: 4Fe-4S binding protein [Desulfobacterales bacterium]|nr:MAG: 4Fe-4S binding protein [Desulfobacterales bacterium]
MQNVYMRLARHLEYLIMGYPYSEELIDLLKEMFSPAEAQVALAIPNNLAPLEVVGIDTILSRTDLPESSIVDSLASLSSRSMIYTAPMEDGTQGYALLQVGYGIPQTFFWGGQADDRAKRMAKLVLNYFSVPTTGKVYGGASTKTYKYSPASLTIEVPMQGVMPNEQIGPIVEAATKIAVAHCPCRMSAKMLGRTDCPHSLEVCIKYDELAQFVIDRGLAREISKQEAYHILTNCEKEGLVHMVDNAQGQIKHTCNCCGHYCWNVGIIRRRKIPRDQLMAVYFIRETELDECIGCGNCAEICPVDAVKMIDDRPQVDPNWCIGCGVCAVSCPAEIISIKRRLNDQAPDSFADLHQRIKTEKGLK